MISNPWVSLFANPPHAKVRLFCFPYAGAGASAYFRWSRDLAPSIAVHAIQLPGREGRLSEPLLSDAGEMVRAIVAAIEPLLDRPYAFFGHSMGTVLAFEAARQLRSRPPLRLFVAGRGAPHIEHGETPLHRLPDAAFLAETVRRYDGIPPAILAEPDLVKLFTPILRADLKAIETYRYADGPRLSCGITALHGMEDRGKPEEMRAWITHTDGQFDYREIPGGHFFIQTAREQVLDVIRRALLPPVEG
jgi:medium-chain acyl-[acyl-carrier-protein] hydrolase